MNKKILVYLFVLILIIIGISACNAAPKVLDGDAQQGGLLYDKWWKELDIDAPTDEMPLWANQESNTRSGSDTLRCKECHGWDYQGAAGAYASGSHFTGFSGVFQLAGGDSQEIIDALTGKANSDHDFSQYMSEEAINDLATFIQNGLIDMSLYINDDKSVDGDVTAGQALYASSCASCHGEDAKLMNFGDDDDPEYLSDLAAGNPWEVMHKIANGQPASSMPSGIEEGMSFQSMADIIAYLQHLAKTLGGDAQQGGLLYDKWWKTLGIDEPTGEMPLWANQDSNTRTGSDTMRCKECHGWDYQGATGAYSSGSHFTGFPGVFQLFGGDSDTILAALNGEANSDHDFSQYMSEEALLDLATFIQSGLIDMSMYVNADKSAAGDAAAGQPLYASDCASCHGDDAMLMNFGDDDDPEYLFDLAAGNPWGVLHKIANGQPATGMPSEFAAGMSIQSMVDIVAYLQSLVID